MPFLCDGADFDGTNDFMARGADLTGIADGKAGTFYGFIRIDGGNGAARTLFTLRSGTLAAIGVQVGLTTGNKIRVVGMNAANTIILDMVTTPTYLAGASWISILSSWNLATGVSQLYIDDAEPALDTDTATDDTLDYTRGNVGIGGLTEGSAKMNGPLAELFFHTTAIDLSVAANRRLFISAANKPVNLGADGSTPLGVQPLVYQHLDDAQDVADFDLNAGSGGNFTITGTLATSDTSPSDGQEPVADFSGTPLSGASPFTVTFTDLTTNEPTSWSWDFGDGSTSTSQNPSHEYQTGGSFDVELTATSNAGTDVETKLAYIDVTAGGGGGRKKKKRKVIRYSDFETREEFGEAVMAAIQVRPPPGPVPEPVPIDEDDDAILIALARILH